MAIGRRTGIGVGADGLPLAGLSSARIHPFRLRPAREDEFTVGQLPATVRYWLRTNSVPAGRET